jgi:hypothetical protein
MCTGCSAASLLLLLLQPLLLLVKLLLQPLLLLAKLLLQLLLPSRSNRLSITC